MLQRAAWKKATAVLIVAALVSACPGLPAARAAGVVLAPVKAQSMTLGQPGAFTGGAQPGPQADLHPISRGPSLDSVLPGASGPSVRGRAHADADAPSPARVQAAAPVTGTPASPSGPAIRPEPSAQRTAAARPAVRAALSRHVSKLHQARRNDPSGIRTSAALHDLYHGAQRSGGDAAAAPVRGAESRNPDAGLRKSPTGLREKDADAQRGVERLDAGQAPAEAGNAKPKSSLSRSFKIGIVAAAIGLIFQFVIPVVASAFGWEPHPGYKGPSPDMVKSAVDAVRLWTAAVVMAPITEEVLFRGGLMGGLSWLGSKLGKSGVLRFWVPAILSSLVFVAVHETADPVLFSTRLIGALIMARVFHKEGLFASTAMHMAHNAFAMSGLMGLVLFGKAGAAAAVLGAAGIGLGLSIYSWLSLRKDRKARKEGLVVPYRLTPARALVLALISVAGVAFASLSPLTNVLWGGAALALVLYAVVSGRLRGPPKRGGKRPAA
ncbi:MAG: CPBP family glutamic-type intramembrane protease [Elusimicrobiota bacterium]